MDNFTAQQLNDRYLALKQQENGKLPKIRIESESKAERYFPAMIAFVVVLFFIFCFVMAAHASDIRLSEHFVKSEFACRCCGECRVNFQLVMALEELRARVNAPVIITSGYRCPDHNKVVGGAARSQHQYGNAVDIKVKGYSPAQVAQLAKECGFTFTKVYRSWTHIDVRPVRIARAK